MSVQSILSQVREVDEMLHVAAQMVARNPSSFSAKSSLRSWERNRADLVNQLTSVLNDERRELCRYSFLVDSETVPVLSVNDTLGAFTDLLAYALSAYNGSRVLRGQTPDRQFVDRTQLGIAFTFAGSIGIGLLGPAKRIDAPIQLEMFRDSAAGDIKSAIELIGDLANTRSPKDWNAKSGKYGFALITKFQRWLKSHYQHELPVSISVGEEAVPDLRLSLKKIVDVLDVVKDAHEEVEEESSVPGAIIRIDDKRKSRVRIEVLLSNSSKSLTLQVPYDYPFHTLKIRTKGIFEYRRTYRVNYVENARARNEKFELIRVQWADETTPLDFGEDLT